MKNSNHDGCEHHDNAQAAVEQASFVSVANTLSHHPHEQAEAIPPLDAIPLAWGKPQAGALDKGSCSATNIAAMDARDMQPYIATGREPPHPRWQSYCAQQPAPPPADARPKVQMAYTLPTEIGGAIYRLRTCTVEPVRGIIKDILGVRQFSLRGLQAAAGEWCLVCTACTLTRLHTLTLGYVRLLRVMRDGARRTLSCSGTKRAQTPLAPGRSRIRPGFSGQMVDYGRL